MIGKWFALVAAVPIGLVLIAAGIGAVLPRDHVVRGERTVRIAPQAVAARLRDVAGYPTWRSSVDRVGVLGRDDGQIRFVEHSGDAIAFAMAEEAAGRRFRSTIADPDLPFGGYWIITVDPAGNDSRVAVEEHGEVGNPLFRFVSAVILGHSRTLEAWLGDLERSAERSAVDGPRFSSRGLIPPD